MPFKMLLWENIEGKLNEIHRSKLEKEDKLEEWIATDSSILGMNVIIIGRQVVTDFGGRIDLLGINQHGDVVIFELKRDKTPREVVAQILDYASWVKGMTPKLISEICYNYLNRELDVVYNEYFMGDLPDSLNANHLMIIVASELDDSSERIVEYLSSDYGVNINVIFFNFYQNGSQEFVGRAWLMDPESVQQKSEIRRNLQWSGYYYVNIDNNWEDCRNLEFISAGGGDQYIKPLRKLRKGDKIFAYLKGNGYVGFGEVIHEAVKQDEYIVNRESKKVTELSLKNSEVLTYESWFVTVNWIKTFQKNKAKAFRGIFSNPHIVCKIYSHHDKTLTFLEKEFGISDE